jgi:hypothetical protein
MQAILANSPPLFFHTKVGGGYIFDYNKLELRTITKLESVL